MSNTEKSKLGLWTGTSMVAGTMIGSGVFLLPASLAAFGGISILGWIVSTIGAVLIALVLSRLSRQIPKTGGPYVYTRSAMGETLGFLVGWGYWFAILTGGAAIAVACVGYLGIFFPVLTEKPVTSAITALVIIWILVIVNVRGVREAGVFQLVTLVLKLLPLAMVIFAGLFYFQPDHFQPFNLSENSTFSAISATGALTLWAFCGLESVTVAAEDMEDPEKNVARVTIYGVLLAATVYILGTVAVMGILPSDVLQNSNAPFADAATARFGDLAGSIVAIGAIIACLGALNGIIFVQGRVPFAMAKDNLFPVQFSRLSKRGTPAAALIVSGIITTIFIALNYSKSLVELFTYIILLSTLSILLPYAFSAIAELILLAKNKESMDKRLVTKNLILGLGAFLYAFWMIFGVGQEAGYWGLLLLIAGLPVYVYFKWTN
jgi:APA family basic amino acid/polyamine antiporter